MQSRQTDQLSNYTETPTDLTWSPDGKQIAFVMFVPDVNEPLIKLPKAPPGATWAAPAKIITKLDYRADGKGYLRDGYTHLFVMPAEGGKPAQLTDGPYLHRGPLCWTADGKHLLFAANRTKDWEYNPKETDLYKLSLETKKMEPLTQRIGPDTDPALSPDGTALAYLGFDDKYQGYQPTLLYLLKEKQDKAVPLTAKLDRDGHHPVWARDGKGIYFLYEDHGIGKVGLVALDGTVKTVAEDVGGVTLDRPYASGSYSVSDNGTVAFTQTDPQHPADVAIYDPQAGKVKRLTSLNSSFFAGKQLGSVEEITFKSSFDGRKIEGWILKPPGFDPAKKYPLILEIHGGPFANYGPRFSAEMQLYAAAGYVVFYCNPRGSTSYGEDFGNLIHHDYPNHDYDDLMSGVDAVISKGYIDAKQQFVTGGSGGGVLTAWIIGKTKRFAAAVVSKPVINWYSFMLTTDLYAYFNKYWFPGPPWDNAEHYLKRSPLSLVKNVTTPTMLITGEDDHRTPISESEQYYQALKLLKVKTVLVRLPGASHNTSAHPSQMLTKVACVVQWFNMHKKGE
jgi:acylaminoacyl-peptidase